MHIDVEYLKEFIAMVEEGNYTEAAEKMYISQSTLFKHIKSLENELGVSLFEKSGRKITVTQYGNLLIPYARQVIKLTDHVERDIQITKESELTLVRMGAEYRTQNLVKAFCNLDDDYRVKVVGRDTRKFLLEGKCDLAILLIGLESQEELDHLNAECDSVKLGKEYMDLLVPAKHPLAKCKSVKITDLNNEEFIMIGLNPGEDMGQTLAAKAGVEPNFTTSCHVGTEAVELVGMGLGLCALHRGSIDEIMDVAALGCKWVEFDPRVELEIELYWRKDAKLSRGAKKFRQFVMEYYGVEVPEALRVK